jgi:hypothetical protein
MKRPIRGSRMLLEKPGRTKGFSSRLTNYQTVLV